MVFTAHGRTTEQHVVVAGAGRVGRRTARVLGDYGHEVYVIERDPETVARAAGLRTAVVVEGDARDLGVLRQTDPGDADVLAALTGDAETNVAVCAEMQHLADDLRTVARVDTPERAASAPFVDEVVYPERAGSTAAVNRIQADDVRTLADVSGDLDVLDVRVDPRSPVAGKRLDEVRLPDGSRVISDADGTALAGPETALEPGRRYLVAAESGVADDVHRFLVG